MTRRGWLRAVAGVVAGLCVRVREKAAGRRGGDRRIVVELRAHERNSIITVERDGAVIATTRVPIGDRHFSSDVAICGHLPLNYARWVTETYGILPEASRHGSIYLMTTAGQDTGARWSGGLFIPRKLLADVLIARGGILRPTYRRG